VIVVLANRSDDSALALVERAQGDASLLTARDLSVPGWRHSPTGGDETAVIGGRRIARSEITAVLTRLPAIAPAALAHIDPSDREFVASEMNAFLLSWLSRIECLVVNRPTAGSLMGPAWSRERWLVEGCRAGFEPFSRTAPVQMMPPVPTRMVVVIGDACVGDVPLRLGARALELARRGGVTLLGICVDDRDRLIAVEPFPDVARPEVADHLLSFLRRGSRTTADYRGAA
jgi:hypothetical protein